VRTVVLTALPAALPILTIIFRGTVVRAMHATVAVQVWRPLLCSVGLAVGLIACGSSASTNVTGPSPVKCQVTLSSASGSFGSAGGSGNITVSTSRECAWSASASGPWVHITGGQSGQGDGTVSYSVDANGAGSPRQANVVVNGQQSLVSQRAAPCGYDISSAGNPLTANGGQTSIDLRTLDGCPWTAAANAAWATITPHSGEGPATLALTIAPNAGPERTVTLTIGSDQVVLRQLSPAAPTPAPSPTPAPNPTPAPPPSPTPAPQPPPPPPSPTPAPNPIVDLKGQVSQLSGRCPTISFLLDNTTSVRTTIATSFERGSCKDVKNRNTVTVHGERLPDNTVVADSVVVRQ